MLYYLNYFKMTTMSDLVTLFQNFLDVMLAGVLAYTAYSVFDKYIDRQDRKDAMKTIAETHQMAISSMMGIHSMSKTHEAINNSEKQNNGGK